MRLLSYLSVLVLLTGCEAAKSPSPQETKKAEDAKVAFRPEIFEEVKRALVELQTALDTGLNRKELGDGLKKLKTAVTLLKGKAQSPAETKLSTGYSEVAQIYQDSADIWDAELRNLQLEPIVESRIDSLMVASNLDKANKCGDFKILMIKGIPLKSYYEDNPQSMGIDELIARYSLPVKDYEEHGWKYVPKRSAKVIWVAAGKKAEEIEKAAK